MQSASQMLTMASQLLGFGIPTHLVDFITLAPMTSVLRKIWPRLAHYLSSHACKILDAEASKFNKCHPNLSKIPCLQTVSGVQPRYDTERGHRWCSRLSRALGATTTISGAQFFFVVFGILTDHRRLLLAQIWRRGGCSIAPTED